MDFFQITLIIGVITGFSFVFFSFFGKGEKNDGVPKNDGDFFLEKKLEAMESGISEADNVLAELGNVSQNVFSELDRKYNELLFLYNLIDEKKNELTASSSPVKAGENTHEHTAAEAAASVASDGMPESAYKNPRLKRILELKQSGMSIGQIAKELDMGQGEVSLIMGLFNYGKKS